MKNFYTIDIKSYNDERGCLTPFEYEHNCPFKIKRAFVLKNIPNENVIRGNHINTISKNLIIALNGKVTIDCEKDGVSKNFVLDKDSKALFIDNGVYRKLRDFSKDAILLCLSDTEFNKEEFV